MSHSYNSIEEVLKAVKSNQLSINDAKAQLSHYDGWAAKSTYIEHSVRISRSYLWARKNKRTNH